MCMGSTLKIVQRSTEESTTKESLLTLATMDALIMMNSNPQSQTSF